MRYAIGEIALVVIGILIALSVNNWNEERKQNDKGLKALIKIKKEFIENKNLLKWVITLHKRTEYSTIRLLELLTRVFEKASIEIEYYKKV